MPTSSLCLFPIYSPYHHLNLSVVIPLPKRQACTAYKDPVQPSQRPCPVFAKHKVPGLECFSHIPLFTSFICQAKGYFIPEHQVYHTSICLPLSSQAAEDVPGLMILLPSFDHLIRIIINLSSPTKLRSLYLHSPN